MLIRVKTIMIFVVTLDGKITRWGNPDVRLWTSHEDQVYFSKLMKGTNLIVMGSKSYNADQTKPRDGRLIIVMTRNPENYRAKKITGQLEFSDKTPSELVDDCRKIGYKQMLMLGGPAAAASFLKENQIDEVWLTIEPRIFGSGGNFVTEQKFDINLRLLSMEKINDQGTLVVKYEVVKAVN
jgi:dihydrofolate reductase